MLSGKGTTSNASQNSGSKAKSNSNKILMEQQKRIVLEYDSDLKVHMIYKIADEKKLTCEWLLREGVKNMKAIAEKKKLQKDFSKILAFTSKSKNILVDYWLTLPDMDLSLLEDGTVLVPYFKTKSSGSTSQDSKSTTDINGSSVRSAKLTDFEFITLLGKGGFSKVFLGIIVNCH